MAVLGSSTYRYIWNYDGYDVQRVHFYNDNGEMFSTERGYIQPLHDKTNPSSYDDRDRFSLRVSGDYLQRRNKVNLDRKEHFYVRNKTSYETVADIYLYVGEDSDLQLKIVDSIKKKCRLTDSNNLITTHDIAEIRSKYLLEPIYISRTTKHKTTTTDVGKKVKEINDCLEQHRECSIDTWRLETLLKYFDVTLKTK